MFRSSGCPGVQRTRWFLDVTFSQLGLRQSWSLTSGMRSAVNLPKSIPSPPQYPAPPQGTTVPPHPRGDGHQMTPPPPPGGVGTTPDKPFSGAYSAEFMASHAMHTIQISGILNAQHPLISAVMHNFSSTTFVRDGSILFTMRRRALDNSQHRVRCGTDIAHNSALREHFQRSEECKGSEQRR